MIGKVIQRMADDPEFAPEIRSQDIAAYLQEWDTDVISKLPGLDIDYAVIKQRIVVFPGQVESAQPINSLEEVKDITRIWLERKIIDLHNADIAMVPEGPDPMYDELHPEVERSVAYCEEVERKMEFIDEPNRSTRVKVKGAEMWPIDQAKVYLDIINALDYDFPSGCQGAYNFLIGELAGIESNIKLLFAQYATGKTPDRLDAPLGIKDEARAILEKQFEEENKQLYDLKEGLQNMLRVLKPIVTVVA